jgi:hypothetical protein
VELFLANEQVDQIADYASRGRIYERLTDGELAEGKPAPELLLRSGKLTGNFAESGPPQRI